MNTRKRNIKPVGVLISLWMYVNYSDDLKLNSICALNNKCLKVEIMNLLGNVLDKVAWYCFEWK